MINVLKNFFNKEACWAGGMAQVVERLPNNCEDLNQIPVLPGGGGGEEACKCDFILL
jgi:hypothetical protein